MPPSEDRRCDNRLAPNAGYKEDVEEVRSPVAALSLLSLLLYEDMHCRDAVRLFLDSIPLLFLQIAGLRLFRNIAQ